MLQCCSSILMTVLNLGSVWIEIEEITKAGTLSNHEQKNWSLFTRLENMIYGKVLCRPALPSRTGKHVQRHHRFNSETGISILAIRDVMLSYCRRPT